MFEKNFDKTRAIFNFCRKHSTKFFKILSLNQEFVLNVHNVNVTSLFAITILVSFLVVCESMLWNHILHNAMPEYNQGALQAEYMFSIYSCLSSFLFLEPLQLTWNLPLTHNTQILFGKK